MTIDELTNTYFVYSQLSVPLSPTLQNHSFPSISRTRSASKRMPSSDLQIDTAFRIDPRGIRHNETWDSPEEHRERRWACWADAAGRGRARRSPGACSSRPRACARSRSARGGPSSACCNTEIPATSVSVSIYKYKREQESASALPPRVIIGRALREGVADAVLFLPAEVFSEKSEAAVGLKQLLILNTTRDLFAGYMFPGDFQEDFIQPEL